MRRRTSAPRSLVERGSAGRRRSRPLLAFHSGAPERSLIICFAMGTTQRSALSWHIDSTVVELVPSVPKLFSFYHPDAPLTLNSENSHVVIDDGRAYLKRSSGAYDVIILDPPPPVGAATSSLLYSKEFYETVKSHLRAGEYCSNGFREEMLQRRPRWPWHCRSRFLMCEPLPGHRHPALQTIIFSPACPRSRMRRRKNWRSAWGQTRFRTSWRGGRNRMRCNNFASSWITKFR